MTPERPSATLPTRSSASTADSAAGYSAAGCSAAGNSATGNSAAGNSAAGNTADWGELLALLCGGRGPRSCDLSALRLPQGRALVVSNRMASTARATILHYRFRAGWSEVLMSRALAAAVTVPGLASRATSLVDLGLDPDADRVEGLWADMARAIDVELVTFGAVLRPPGTEWTPIVHLFDGNGERRAVAKIGFSPAARRCIRREAAALRAAAVSQIDAVVPRAMGLIEHDRATVLLQSPLPRLARPLDECEIDTDTVSLVNSITATDPLDESHTAYLLERVDQLGLDPEGSWRELLSEPVPRARCHGDLVHWNLARAGRRLLIWDWEYSFPDAPLGFDLLQSRYRMAREAGHGVNDALSRANAGSERLLSELGLDQTDRRRVTDIHTLDAAVRVASRIDVAGASIDLAGAALAERSRRQVP